MNKRIFTISAAAVGSLFAVSTVSADFLGMSYDTVENGMAGLTTYRVYADIDPGELDAVYGDADNVLTVSSDNGFFQSIYAGATSLNNNAAFWALFPSMEFDSMVTIGLLSSDGNSMQSIGIDFTAFEAGGSIVTDNGTWFATPDQPQVLDVGGRVLVGQFTVGDDDHVFGVLSMQGKEADATTNWTAAGVDFDTVPAPGALALLGLAGLAARRRRK